MFLVIFVNKHFHSQCHFEIVSGNLRYRHLSFGYEETPPNRVLAALSGVFVLGLYSVRVCGGWI